MSKAPCEAHYNRCCGECPCTGACLTCALIQFQIGNRFVLCGCYYRKLCFHLITVDDVLNHPCPSHLKLQLYIRCDVGRLTLKIFLLCNRRTVLVQRPVCRASDAQGNGSKIREAEKLDPLLWKDQTRWVELVKVKMHIKAPPVVWHTQSKHFGFQVFLVWAWMLAHSNRWSCKYQLLKFRLGSRGICRHTARRSLFQRRGVGRLQCANHPRDQNRRSVQAFCMFFNLLNCVGTSQGEASTQAEEVVNINSESMWVPCRERLVCSLASSGRRWPRMRWRSD